MDFKYLKHLAKRGASYIHPKGYFATRLLIDELELKPGQKVLEAGCGTGATIADIALEYDVMIDGVDILDEMITSARQRMKFLKISDGVRIQRITSGEKLPFENNSFDKIYTESVLGFQQKQVLEFITVELYRVLKPDGIFVVNEALWRENVTDETVKEIYDETEKDFGLSQASSDNINLKSFLTVCEEAGFKLVKQINLNELDSESSPSKSKSSEKFGNNKKIKSLFSVFYLTDEINFKKKLNRHKNDGACIESFLLKFIKTP